MLSNEELHSFVRSLNIVRVGKFRKLRWAGHVTRKEEGTSICITISALKTFNVFTFICNTVKLIIYKDVLLFIIPK